MPKTGRPKGSKDSKPRAPRKTKAEQGIPYKRDLALAASMADESIPKCACGCGLPAIQGRVYKRGHRPRDLPCKCGCGATCKPGCEYIFGHQWIGKTNPAVAGENNPSVKRKALGLPVGKPPGAKDGPDVDRSAQAAAMKLHNPMHDPVIKKSYLDAINTEAYKIAHAKGLHAAHMHGFTGLNDKVEAMLIDRGMGGFQREYLVRWCRCDFAWPDEKVVLEVQGCRWHLCPTHPKVWANLPDAEKAAQAARDTVKREQLETWGWTVLYVWEHDVNDLLA